MAQKRTEWNNGFAAKGFAAAFAAYGFGYYYDRSKIA